MKKPAQETRQHILDVAKALMTQKGYTAVGLAEVVAAAGVPKGSFYYYRSEEHTSELQSPCNIVCRLLLEKKKKPVGIVGSTWLARRLTHSRLRPPLGW